MALFFFPDWPKINEFNTISVLAIATQVLVVMAVLMALLVGFLARRQFAVLRAIGASRSYVFVVIWREVSLLIAAGAALGLMLGWVWRRAFGLVQPERRFCHAGEPRRRRTRPRRDTGRLRLSARATARQPGAETFDCGGIAQLVLCGLDVPPL